MVYKFKPWYDAEVKQYKSHISKNVEIGVRAN